MKYFKVTAKCGHVGRGKYYMANFYVYADNAKEAARKARDIPRVKHDKKDAILSVCEVTEEVYMSGTEENSNNPYFSCKNIQEHRMNLQLFAENIYFEESYERISLKQDRKRDKYIQKAKVKNHRYAKMMARERSFEKEII